MTASMAEVSSVSAKKFYPALDGLRAIALLMVIFDHYVWPPKLLRWGWVGVDVFFVLSGFLITGILYDTRNDSRRFHNFYLRRTLRIFPLYYSIFFITLLTVPIFHWIFKPAWFLWVAYVGNYGIPRVDRESMTVLSSGLPLTPALQLHFGHFWTLCVEEQFYLVWPLVVYLVKDRTSLLRLCLLTVCICPLLRLGALFVVPATVLHFDFLYTFTPLRIDSLLLGGFIALCLRGPEAVRVKALAPWIAAGVPAAWALIEGGSFVVRHRFIEPTFNSQWMTTAGFSLIDLFAAGVILLAIDSRTTLFKFLNLAGLRWLGRMSYGFYIFHQLFYDVYERLTEFISRANAPHFYLKRLIIAFCFTLALSWLSFTFFESPFLQLRIAGLPITRDRELERTDP